MHHLVKDSIDLVKFLEQHPMPATAKFYKCDVDEFYMSGEHTSLKEDCSEVVSAHALEFLLTSQYVKSGRRLAQVIKGSGMGEESSGAISDYSLFCRSERNFLLTDEVRRKYGIIAYVRYRDDFVIITNGTEHVIMQEFFHRLRERTAPFLFKVESISSRDFVMLDLHFFKGQRFFRTGLLDIEMHFKKSAQGVPLSDRSCHPGSIHRLWPLARFSCFNKRCSSNMSAIEAKLIFIEKLARHHPEHVSHLSLVEHLRDRRRIFESKAGFSPGTWLVIPYHPRLTRMSAILHKVAEQWEASSFKDWQPRVSWKIEHTSLSRAIVKDATKKCAEFRSRAGG